MTAPEPVLVMGRFVTEAREPVTHGSIRFIPSKIWFVHDGATYPSLAPEMDLDEDGRFSAWVSPTEGGTEGYYWYYTVDCPIGRWKIRISPNGPHLLKDLLPKRFSA